MPELTLDTPVLIWMTVAIAAAIIEILIPHFGVLFVSLAALASAVAAYFSLGVAPQSFVFVVVLGLSYFALRPRLVARLGAAPGVPSRTEAMMGAEGVVTEAIDTSVGAGRVNVAGQDWAARSTAPLAAGTKIRVVGADGIVLEVRPV